MSRNEFGRTIQYEPGGRIYNRPSEAEIHEANQMVNPRGCDCLACIAKRNGEPPPVIPEISDEPPF